MTVRFRVFIGNDNVVELAGLQDATQGSYINTATVNVTLLDSDGNQVAGQTWPLSMSYVPTTQGIYRATLEDDLALTEDGLYTAEIRADAGADLKGLWKVPCRAEVRQS